MTEKQTVTVDGVDYNLDEVSGEGLALIESVRFVEAELKNAEAMVAVFKTAHAGYMSSLKEELSKKLN